jgi:site-specific recombinase XerD
MLISYFKSPSSIAQYRAGLAGPFLDQFVSWLADRGYQRVSIRRHVREVAHYATWAASEGLCERALDSASLVTLRNHLTDQERFRDPSGNQNHIYQSACVFVRFLEAIDVVRRPSTEHSKARVPALYLEFCEWMKAHRGTRDITLASYRLPVVNLLQTLGSPNTFTVQLLRAYFLQQVSQVNQEKSKNIATAIRMFLRFLIARGDCMTGMDFAIPTVARWRLSSVPKYLPPEAVETLIASCDQSLPLGARDRAMILLAARLGLRASDISGLQFQDLLWSKGSLIVAGKNRREVELPLPQEVGNAILCYLRCGRPKVTSEYVFITTKAPFIPITRNTVGRAVSRAIIRTGINAPSHGAHLLRHSAATNMLRDGMSLHAIGELLRHRSIETTTVYAKLDVKMLKEIAMPWPGAEPC